jgi:hypothetical protein
MSRWLDELQLPLRASSLVIGDWWLWAVVGCTATHSPMTIDRGGGGGGGRRGLPRAAAPAGEEPAAPQRRAPRQGVAAVASFLAAVLAEIYLPM